MIKNSLFILIISVIIYSCGAEKTNKPITIQPKKEKTTEDTLKTKEVVFSIQTIENENGWGYIILKNEKPFIRQPNIPSIAGNKGFDTEKKAEIVAKFIVFKIQNGIMPPSTNKNELDSLGVL
ncbi:MAG: DUF4907 domain-containing protein [Saprospiraceae bacterium]|nr:DUF4907 domain-containing protein [Saprospiraceae bacterium]